MRQLTRLLTLLVLAGCADFERERPEAVAPSVQAGIEAQLAAREYRASENAEGLQAPNRAHNLRTYFDSTGIRVHDRTAGGSPELLKLSLSRVGREGALADVAPGSEVVADESRVEIRRPGLVEWFVNGPDGLEQGFTLAEKPRGDGKLVLELQLEGAKAKRRGKSLVFVTETGRKLAYGKLAAWDAHGDPLAAKLQLAGADRIAVSVDDAGAAYPILIDPLLQETADALVQGEQPLAQLGSSVASAGDVNGDGYADVIVGAPSFDSGSVNEGAALIFHGGPDGIPDAGPLSAQTQLEGNQPSAVLGDSVASAGDVNGDGYADVIVGAPGYDHGQLDEGMAVVFLGSASGVADGNPTSAHAQLESDQVGAQFGSSVASAGDVNGDGYADVIVGDPLYDNNNALSAGAAFVFLGSASGVADGNPASAHASLTSASTDSRLGTSVASAGDVNGDGYDDLIVSAPRINSTWTGEGFVLIYMGSAQGVRSGGLSVAASILRSDQLNAHIGDSVASAGDVNGDGYADVIVGASSYDFANLTDTGAAFVFLGSASGVVSIGTPSNAHAKLWGNQTGGALGQSVASAGDVNGDGYADVIVGAYGYDNPTDYEGSAFVYLGSENGLPSGTPNNAFAQLESDQAAAFFGWSVASAGDVNGDGYADVIAGAPNYENDDYTSEGAAFVYLGGGSGVARTYAGSAMQSKQASAELGYSVASAGDVNGDGYGDVIVGAPSYDNGQTNEGAAFIFHGRAEPFVGDPTSANTQLESDQANANLGRSVASAGDVNGDGYGDVIVGASAFDNGETDEGAAFVFLGSSSGVADGTPLNAHAQLESNQASAQMGWSVASAGDVNGNGYADVVVGAWQYDSSESNEGAAFVFLGSAGGLMDGNPLNAHAQLESNQANALLGWSVASAGDVNGDGYGDVIVGAWNYTNGQAAEGAAFLFLGGASGLADGNPGNAHAQLESDQVNGNLGSSVASAGDVNGDGFGDVIVGAPLYDFGLNNEGAAFLFLGSASGIADGNPGSAHAQLESDQAGAELGVSVSSAGDVNGDGFADVIVGADNYDNGQTNEGAAFVFLGSASGIADGNPVNAHAQLESNQGGALSALSVASAGDVNGDGFADVIFGAHQFDDVQTNEGVAFVFQGSGIGGGRPVFARQRRGDGSGLPVQPWGGAHSGTGFVAELRANHPQGRGRVKAQFEACPQTEPFGDAGCTSALTPSWILVNSAMPDVTFSHTFSGLATGELYRWRARVLHAPATGAIPANPAHGPWRRLGAQSAEADIRLVPEPGALLSLASGATLLAVLARRRRRS